MTTLNQFLVTIELDDNQTSLVALWLNRFNQNAVHMWSTPELNGGSLSIHPADFPNLLLYARLDDCTELEFYRIRKLGASIFSSALGSQKSKLSSELCRMVEASLAGLRFAERAGDEVPIHF